MLRVHSEAAAWSTPSKGGLARLVEILQHNEGKMLEFKRDASSPENILESLVAFATTSGGTVAIGVEDVTKRVRGVPYVRVAEEGLAKRIADSMRPPGPGRGHRPSDLLPAQLSDSVIAGTEAIGTGKLVM